MSKQKVYHEMIIMKFGGSSVADADQLRRIANYIIDIYDGEYFPVVVLSAMGQTTLHLIEAGKRSIDHQLVDIKKIETLHLQTAKELQLSQNFIIEIQTLLKSCRRLLKGLTMTGELTASTNDLLMSFGERLSVRLFSGYLETIGLPSKFWDAWDLGIRTTGDTTGSSELEKVDLQLVPNAFSLIASNLHKEMNANRIPIITGFLAKNEIDRISTLGRGGSDLTASLIGAAVKAKEIQIWTDTNGVLTADPRVVDNPSTISHLTFDEASELALFGAKILHPRTIQPAAHLNIPISVKNSHNGHHRGTLITKSRTKENPHHLLTALTLKSPVILIDIRATEMLGQYGFLATVFSVFEKLKISVDVIATSEISISLTLDKDTDMERVQSLQSALRHTAEIHIMGEYGIVALIGNKDKAVDVVGLACDTLKAAGVPLVMISLGASKVNTSLVVPKECSMKSTTCKKFACLHTSQTRADLKSRPLLRNQPISRRTSSTTRSDGARMSSLIASLSELSLKGQSFTPRWGLSAAYVQGKVFIFGGYLWFHGVEGFFHDLYELDINTNAVRRVVPEGSSVPAPRFGHTLVADPVRNQLILFGGRNSVESFSDAWSFNVAKGQWTQLSSKSETVKVPSTSTNLAATTSLSAIDEPQTSRKTEKRGSRKDREAAAELSRSKSNNIEYSVPQPRSWHTATYYRNAVYVYGGWDHHNRVFNDLWAFDLGTHQWNRIDPPDAMSKPPHGRSCHQAAIWGEFLYIFGGLRDGDAAIGDMWKFSFEARGWTPVECGGSKPVGRTSAAGIVVGDSWVIHGGLTDFPRTGLSAISEVLEFHFPTSNWIHRSVLLSDNVTSAAKRYGHVAVVTPHSTAVTLLGGAEKYASACAHVACRIDLLPSQAQVTELQQDICSTTRVAQMNRERVTELVEIVQTCEAQIRQLKTENTAVAERVQSMQTQMAALHQQHSALQSSFHNVQQTLSAIEQFIPMMRSVGAAIANFGNAAQQSWTQPSSISSLKGNVAGVNASNGLTLQSSGDLR